MLCNHIVRLCSIPIHSDAPCLHYAGCKQTERVYGGTHSWFLKLFLCISPHIKGFKMMYPVHGALINYYY